MYLEKPQLKISLDLDDTIFSFRNHYLEKFGVPKDDKEITKNVQTKLIKDNNFWLSQPIINYPNFVPHMYCTARIISKYLIKKQLCINGLPKAPIYQIHGYGLSKYSKIKMGGCHVHVDDSLSVFTDLNLKGIPCLLLDAPNNQSWGPIGRIYTLDKDEIEDTYHLFLDTMFPHFKELIR